MVSSNWHKAIDFSTQAIERDTMYAHAYAVRSMAYIQSGRFDKAIHDLNTCLQYGIVTPERIYLQRANAHLGLGNSKAAMTDIEIAEKGGIAPEWIHFMRSVIYFQMRDYNKALDYAQATLEMKPDFDWAHIQQALIYDAMDMHQKALNIVMECIEKYPKSSFVQSNAGMLLAKYGKFEQALACSNKAVVRKKREPAGYSARANTHFLIGNYSAALADNNIARKLFPNEKSLIAQQAASLYAMGKPEKALEKWQELQDIPAAEPHTVDSLQADYHWADQFVETLREVEAMYRKKYLKIE
jgi:tetratricopeptide (TPR) repeat protein